MPDIAVATPTLAVANLSPDATGGAAGAAALDATTASFAKVLQQQITDATTNMAGGRLATIVAAIAADAEPAGTESSLDALLPALAGTMTAATAGGRNTGKAATDTDMVTDAVSITPPVMAAPVTASPLAASATPTPAAATSETETASAKLVAGKSTAILAATSDIAGQKTSAGEGFSTASTAAGSEPTALVTGTSVHSAHNVAAHVSAAAGQTGQTIATPVGQPGWDAEIGNRVAWMANHQVGRAELVLTPPHLGRIEISLTVSGEHATATFVSASPAVREAIENAVPRLREVLADAGVTLGQTHVGADTPQQSPNGGDSAGNSALRPSIGSVDFAPSAGTTTAVSWTTAGRGLVDVFA
jgi:flagellar hook-length control protein FliK